MSNETEMESRKGNQIGTGTARHVYAVKDDGELVIKELKNSALHASGNSNRREFEIWNRIKDSPLQHLFASCKDISDSDRYLLMERLSRLDDTDAIPDMPSWLKDRKRENVGKTSTGQVKVLDYGQVEIDTVCTNAPMIPWPSKEESDLLRKLLGAVDQP
jgi:hypothetical protein